MKRLFFCLMIIASTLLMSSCKKGGASLFTPTSSGLPYEMLVVADDVMWESEVGETLKDVLRSDVPGLPQSESYFSVMRVSEPNFDNTMKLLRNIIIVKISDIYTTPKIKYNYDVYAHPQLVVTIQAPDAQQFITTVENSKETILNLFNNAELNRYVDVMKEKHNARVEETAREKFNLQMWAPQDMKSFKDADSFFWCSKETPTGNQHLVIYSYPYLTKDAFTKEYFIAMRDSVMKANIPGAFEDSYMSTDSLTVEVKDIAVQGAYTFEAKGLWRMKGDFMGGPFVSHSMVDTVNNRVVVGEVFVYEPSKPKKRYIKQMEAALYSMKTLDKKFEEK